MSESNTGLIASQGNEAFLDSLSTQILDEHSSPADPAGAGGSSPSTSDGPEVQAPAGEVIAPLPEWYETAPPEIKALMDHKNISSEQKEFLKSLYGESASLKELPIGTKETISEISTMFPGGMEEIKEAAQNAQTFKAEMEQFTSGDPVQQAELLGNLLTSETADAFVSLVTVASDMLRQTLRDDYTAFASKITRSHIDEVTDGNFAKFGDGALALAEKYRTALNSGNQEEAGRIVQQLASTALQYADWWGGSAKNKIGFGEQTAATAPSARSPLPGRTSTEANDPAILYAQKDSTYFINDYQVKHDGLVNPMISTAMMRELGVRKMELPESWKARVQGQVLNELKSAIDKDPTFLAVVNRTRYKGGDKNSDPRKWDNSDKVKEVILAQVKTRAEKLMPALMKKVLDPIAELRGASKAAPAAKPGEAVRSSSTGPASTAAGDKGGGNWKDKLKAGQIDNAQALLEMTGQV